MRRDSFRGMKTLSDLTDRLEHNHRARSFVQWAKHVAANHAAAFRQDESVPLPRDVDVFVKTAVDAMATGNTSALRRLSQAFVQVLESKTILGRLVGTLMVPPYAKVAGLVNEPDATWIAAGQPIPVVKANLTEGTTDSTAFGVMVGISTELARATEDRAVSLVERILLRALRRAEDRLVLSTDAAVAQVRPAGLLHGVAGLGLSSPAALDNDVYRLWLSVRDGDPLAPFFITSPRAAMYLATLHDDGTPRFANVGPLGGDIAGVPVLTSRAAGDRLVLVDAAELTVTDEGLTIDSSENAAVQMNDAPSGGAAQMVSGFQTNTSFLRTIRYLHWSLLNDDAISFLELPIGGSPS